MFPRMRRYVLFEALTRDILALQTQKFQQYVLFGFAKMMIIFKEEAISLLPENLLLKVGHDVEGEADHSLVAVFSVRPKINK